MQVICKQVEDEVKFAKLKGLTTQDKEKIVIACQLIHKIDELLAAYQD